jgi:hypothetical protein
MGRRVVSRDQVIDPPASAPLQSQPSIATSRTHEAWIFTGEVEKSYLIERIRIGERGLTELAGKSQSSSVLSSLALLSPNHRRAVNKLLERYEYEKGSITGLIPIKGKKSWWTRLTPRRPKDRHPQVVILLQFEQDRERDGGLMTYGKWDYGREEMSFAAESRTMRGKILSCAAKNRTEERTILLYRRDLHGRSMNKQYSFLYQKTKTKTSRRKNPTSPPSQEEAEKLIDKYLAGFTTFSDDGEDRGERGPRGHDTDGVPEDSAVKT